jgi:glycosyltransferase involved in cell wall biosynthesis
LHATSNEEVMSCQGRVPNASISLIPNGVDVPEELPKKEWLPRGKLRMLYMGRLHPIKGIERLIEALAQLRHESFCLTICGDGHSSYAASLRSLVRRLDLETRVTFHGHVRNAEKLHAYMESDVCIVPSFSENFGMVVVEALAHGIPVIASKGTPWAQIEKHGAGFWVENRPQDLAAALTEIARKDLSVMGSIGRKWMREQFQWKSIATQMSDLYRAIA